MKTLRKRLIIIFLFEAAVINVVRAVKSVRHPMVMCHHKLSLVFQKKNTTIHAAHDLKIEFYERDRMSGCR
jgi:hypothetical protein